MIGSMEDDHQWYGAAHTEEVATVTRGGLAMSRQSEREAPGRNQTNCFPTARTHEMMPARLEQELDTGYREGR